MAKLPSLYHVHMYYTRIGMVMVLLLVYLHNSFKLHTCIRKFYIYTIPGMMRLHRLFVQMNEIYAYLCALNVGQQRRRDFQGESTLNLCNDLYSGS